MTSKDPKKANHEYNFKKGNSWTFFSVFNNTILKASFTKMDITIS